MIPLFGYTADNHMLPNQWVKYPELRGDAFIAFDEICARTAALHVPLIVGGDLFNVGKPDSDSVSSFVNSVTEYNLQCLFVQGDHDWVTGAPWACLAARAVHLHKQQVVLGPFRLYGLDYAPRGRIQQDLVDIPPRTDILITHLKWSDVMGVGRTCAAFTDVHNAPVCFSGDYHKMGSFFGQNGDGHAFTLYSPGSSVPTAIDEFSDRVFFVVGYDERDRLVVEQRVLHDTRVGLSTTATTVRELDRIVSAVIPHLLGRAVAAQLPFALQKPVLRVRYYDNIPDAYARLVAATGDAIFLFPEPQPQLEDVVMQPVAAQRTLALSGLCEAVDELTADDADLRTAAHRMLGATDEAAEIRRMHDEFMAAQASDV